MLKWIILLCEIPDEEDTHMVLYEGGRHREIKGEGETLWPTCRHPPQTTTSIPSQTQIHPFSSQTPHPLISPPFYLLYVLTYSYTHSYLLTHPPEHTNHPLHYTIILLLSHTHPSPLLTIPFPQLCCIITAACVGGGKNLFWKKSDSTINQA